MGNIINNKEFNELVLTSKEKVLVDFYADWCGPCRMLGPILEELSKEYTIYKVNVDNEMELAQNYGIMSIPCMIVFKDGKEVNRLIGLHSKSEIEDILK